MTHRPSASRFLDPAGAQAVDAHFDARTGDHSPAGSEGVSKLHGLLALLDGPLPAGASRDREALIATICARATAQRKSGVAGAIQPTPGCPTLSADSAKMTDAFVAGDAEANPVSSLLGLLDANQPTEPRREHVVSRTLDAIQKDIEGQSTRFRLSDARDLHIPRGRFSFRDLVASAAAVLIGAAVIWPSITAVRAAERQEMCASNLQQAGLGVGLFTSADDQRLPASEENTRKSVWWNVGVPQQSHSANLFRLVAGGYTTMHSLSCPCNACAPTNLIDRDDTDWRAPEEVSYSYLLFEQAAPRISDEGIRLLLVDKSPIIDRARNGETFQIDLNSRHHSGRGQNALLTDLSVRFLDRPTLDGDNIWAPRSIEDREAQSAAAMRGFTLQGTEQPADLSDIFVGP